MYNTEYPRESSETNCFRLNALRWEPQHTKQTDSHQALFALASLFQHLCFTVVFGSSHPLSVVAESVQDVELVPMALHAEHCLTGGLAYQTSDFNHKQEPAIPEQSKAKLQSASEHIRRQFKHISRVWKMVASLLCLS